MGEQRYVNPTIYDPISHVAVRAHDKRISFSRNMDHATSRPHFSVLQPKKQKKKAKKAELEDISFS